MAFGLSPGRSCLRGLCWSRSKGPEEPCVRAFASFWNLKKPYAVQADRIGG
jgi:hypothetical protein